MTYTEKHSRSKIIKHQKRQCLQSSKQGKAKAITHSFSGRKKFSVTLEAIRTLQYTIIISAMVISAANKRRPNSQWPNVLGGLLFHNEEVQIVSGLVNLPVLL